jgi:hypothetical protein
MSKPTWIYQNGKLRTEHFSFPYAFRAMWECVNNTASNANRSNPLAMTLIAPTNTHYTYSQAKQLAMDMGLLSLSGHLNSKEFKRI